jgi:non-ribosomal peptide synthetase-like protein
VGKPQEPLIAPPEGPPISVIAHGGRAGPETGTPETGTEAAFADILAGILGASTVPVDGHVFNDLGADSMVMARFCALARKHPDLPSVSMKDIYTHPTIRGLASALTGPRADPVIAGPVARPAVPTDAATSPGPARAVGAAGYILCGTLQLLAFLGYSYLATFIGVQGFTWMSAGSGAVDVYLRAVLFGSGLFTTLSVLPIVAKWVLVGRWRPQQTRVWSLGYFRFWFVKTLVRANPLILLAVGTPLYSLYLRALGAKVGRGVTIFSLTAPVCTDLLTIGDGSIINKDAFLLGYRAHAGQIQTGAVTLGRNVVVGTKTVLDIDTSMGDGAQLGHASALQGGQSVPDGERWHGTPAQRTDVDYLRVEPARCSTLRRTGYCLFSVLQTLLVILPLTEGGLYVLVTRVPPLARLLDPGMGAVTSGSVFFDALTISAALFLAATAGGLLLVTTVPRVLNLFIRPDTVYPLYGLQYSVHRTITRLTNRKFFTYLFGDSSYIVNYLRWIGYNLSAVEQTGSNFGMQVAHDTPFLSTVGSGTMVADGLIFLNADYSSTSFRVSQVSIGAHSFLGNHIAYPSGGRTGDDCLLATKVMIPLDGPVREGVGLLGSPCFEIPRSVARDSRFDHLKTGEALAAKNRYDLRSMGAFLLVRWFRIYLLTVLDMVAIDLQGTLPGAVLATIFALNIIVTTAYFVLVERCFLGFRRLRPKYCSIYDPYFWWHERLWKLPEDSHLRIFDGTPFKGMIWRLMGVRIGKRVFDDGCYITERTLASIGDDTTLGIGSKIQCHSQEDGTFKSDQVSIGAGCTLGVGSMVHYGVTMGDGAVLAPDAFLMKGEEMPPLARWGGNPARDLRSDHQPA